MTSTVAPPTRSLSTRSAWLLGAPLGVSTALGSGVIAATCWSGRPIDADWMLVVLFFPAIPVYLLLLPLFPFLFRALRRGWDPSPLHVLATVVGVSIAIDLAFWWGRS